MINDNRPNLFHILLPARGPTRSIFVFALGCSVVGCLLSACFVLLPSSEPPNDFASLLSLGVCILSPFWGVSALLMLAGASRQKRSGPRALAWGAMSLTALLGTIFVLNANANNPNSFALCSIACAPLVLSLIALAFYYWRKARAEFAAAPASAPQTSSPPFAEPVQTHLDATGSQLQTDLTEWVTNLNLSGSMADDEAAEWLKTLNRPVGPQSPPHASIASQTTTHQPAHTDSAIPNAEADLPAWLRALKPAGADAPKPPSKPIIAETPDSRQSEQALAWLETLAAKHGAKAEELITPSQSRTDIPPMWVQEPTGNVPLPSTPDSTSVSDTQSTLDELSQSLESSKQALDDLLRSPFPEIGATTPPETSANQKTGEKKNQCPHCGTELQGASGQGFIFCYHCGSQVNL